MVTSGYRVTLTYELTAETADSIDNESGVQVHTCQSSALMHYT